ncbi:hypothetical protein ACFQXA_07665 [Nocardiopsis composta]
MDVRFAAAASWVRFVDPRTPDAALMPGPVLPRPAGSPAVAAQWREWQEAVLSGQNPPARPQMLVAEGPPTAPAPDFGPLARWPDLRRHCEGGWDAFQRWFRAFGLVGAGVFADLPAGSSAAPLLATAPGQTARLDVVGLAEPAVLREEPGAALVTLGFVASGRYLSWLRAFTASAPVREEPPDWFDPPVPARPARRRPADIGDHRVFPAAGAAAQWYAFADPGIPGRELLGSPAGRPEAGPGVRREWGRWWDGVPLGSGATRTGRWPTSPRPHRTSPRWPACPSCAGTAGRPGPGSAPGCPPPAVRRGGRPAPPPAASPTCTRCTRAGARPPPARTRSTSQRSPPPACCWRRRASPWSPRASWRPRNSPTGPWSSPRTRTDHRIHESTS